MSQIPYSTSQPNSYQRQVSTEKDWMGIVSLIGAFVFPLAGIIFGHMGLKAYREGEASTQTLAKIGLVLSYVFVGINALIIIFYFFVLLIAY